MTEIPSNPKASSDASSPTSPPSPASRKMPSVWHSVGLGHMFTTQNVGGCLPTGKAWCSLSAGRRTDHRRHRDREGCPRLPDGARPQMQIGRTQDAATRDTASEGDTPGIHSRRTGAPPPVAIQGLGATQRERRTDVRSQTVGRTGSSAPVPAAAPSPSTTRRTGIRPQPTRQMRTARYSGSNPSAAMSIRQMGRTPPRTATPGRRAAAAGVQRAERRASGYRGRKGWH